MDGKCYKKKIIFLARNMSTSRVLTCMKLRSYDVLCVCTCIKKNMNKKKERTKNKKKDIKINMQMRILKTQEY